MAPVKGHTTKEIVAIYTTIAPLLVAMFNEFKELSKKKPDGAVSKNKIKIVNRLLVKCKEVLMDEKVIDYLDIIDEDTVPQNSDIVLTLSQYNAAMKQYFSSHTNSITREWLIK